MDFFFLHTNIKELKNCHLGIISMKIKISKVDIKSGFLSGTEVKIPPANAGDEGLILGQEDTLEKEMATHSISLAWETPW